MSKEKLNRRDFLRLSGTAAATAAAAAAIAACGTPEVVTETVEVEKEVTRVVEKEVEVAAPDEGGAEVALITRPNIITIIGADDVVRLYNEDPVANPNRDHVTLEEQIDGFQPKAMELTRRGENPWDGYIWNNMWIYGYQFIQSDVILPLDEYVANSKVPWAKNVADPGFYCADTVWTAAQSGGKQYAIPCLSYSSVTAYYTKMLEDVGYDGIPDTWDEFSRMLHKIKDAGDEDIVPLAFSPGWHRTPGAVFATFTDKPYMDTPEALTDINSPAGWDSMDMMRGWFQDGLCSLEMVTATDPISDYWQRQRSACAIEASRWVRAGQDIHGVWDCQGANLPVPNAGDPPRTYYLVDGSTVFAGTENPQAVVDHHLTIHGPEGAPADKWWNNQLAAEGAPIHETTFDRLVPEDHHNYWVKETYEALRNSTPAPLTGSQTIMLFHFQPYLEKILWGDVPVKQACAEAADGLQETYDKFQAQVKEGSWTKP